MIWQMKSYALRRFLIVSLCGILYVPYSMIVNKFMCVTQSQTCCRKTIVLREQIQDNNDSYITNPAEDIEFPVNNDVCANISNEGNSVWLLVGVISRATNFERRKSIRATYGSSLKGCSPGPVCLLFIIGSMPMSNNNHAELETEIRLHKDIVQINKIETYRNLVYKSIAFLKWADEHIPHFDFLMKTDDDTFINVPNLFHKLLLFSSEQRFVMGHISSGNQPKRNANSIHFIATSEYAKDTLPNYINGPSYVISGDLVMDLLDLMPLVPLTRVEDVYITGLLASYVNDVTHIGQCGFLSDSNDAYGIPLSSVTVHNPQDSVWESLSHSSQQISLLIM